MRHAIKGSRGPCRAAGTGGRGLHPEAASHILGSSQRLGTARARGTNVDRCPHCNARLLPGDVECRSCKFDLISGRMPGEKSSVEQQRTVRLAITAAVSIVLILAGAVALGNLNREPPHHDPPCMAALKAIQPTIKAHPREIPRCDKTPPGPTDCWSLAGVTTAMLPRRDDLWLKLRPTATGFEITCRSDLDGDGEWTLFQANEDVEGLRISRAAVR
jgi:ribosomal protein L40E